MNDKLTSNIVIRDICDFILSDFERYILHEEGIYFTIVRIKRDAVRIANLLRQNGVRVKLFNFNDYDFGDINNEIGGKGNNLINKSILNTITRLSCDDPINHQYFVLKIEKK